MLDILKERLPQELTIKSVKETNTKYAITFVYAEQTVKADLPKSCAPGCHNEVADHTIITAVSSALINCGEYENAKKWLNKLIEK